MPPTFALQDLQRPFRERRCKACHGPAEAMIDPLLLLGLVYMLAGGRAGAAIPIFTIFIVARIGHSIVYLRAMQS